MKKILLLLICVLNFKMNAQVKFTLQGCKDKTTNIVYIGIPNIFKIMTPQEISISKIVSSQGNVRMNTDGSFSLYVHDVTNEPVEIKYTQTRNGIESELTYNTKYEVKRVPELFQLKIGQQTKGGKVPLAQMQQHHTVNINAEDFNREVKNIKISFTLLFASAGADPVEMQYISGSPESVKFYEKQIKTLKRGDKLFFEQIKMTDESGVSREAENMNFLII